MAESSNFFSDVFNFLKSDTGILSAVTGLNFGAAEADYQADLATYKAEEAWKAYSNTMVRLSDAMNQNVITSNESIQHMVFADMAVDIKQESIIEQAKAEVSAAAAGVKGRSVNQTMNEIQRQAAGAERNRQIELASANLAIDQQRLSSRMNANMAQDYSYNRKPSRASYFLGAAIESGRFAVPYLMGGSDGSGNKDEKKPKKPSAEDLLKASSTSYGIRG